MVNMHFILRDGTRQTVSANEGQTLLEVCRAHAIDIEGACGGAMACSTCHLIVDPAWYGKLVPPSDDETDMLDLAVGVTKTSRLGCQIKVIPAMEGIILKLPAGNRG